MPISSASVQWISRGIGSPVRCYVGDFYPRCPEATDRGAQLLVLRQGEGFAFRRVVPIPLGYLDNVVAGLGDDSLTAEARVELLVGGHIQAIKFIVVGFADTILA